MTDKNARGASAARRLAGLLAILLVVAAVLASVWWLAAEQRHSAPTTPRDEKADEKAGEWADERQCQTCHRDQFRDWQGSHHQLAMLRPTKDTVRGDFNNASLRSDRETTAFFRKGDEFWVRTPDASGKPGEFRVAYTFGWKPLQQYLLEMDDGRLQALGVAWDTEKEHWFHLYDGQGVDAHHPLHWSRPAQNANTRCIDCHTTGFQPGYDNANDRFDSRWQSLGVGCQACHGPASGHLQWTQSAGDDPLKGFTQPLAQGQAQLHTCARCHSRRTPLGRLYPAGQLQDSYLVSQLTPDLYEVDGKILGEVFEHGSFAQSRMHRAGVVCSDCHNPHSGQLRALGNSVCTQCHNPAGQAVRAAITADNLTAGDYDSEAHHHHAPGSAGAQCRNCHMPGKIYMGNDLRHDHSFSSPDPAQALALNHSDACLGCHRERSPKTLVAQFRQWYPDHRPRDGGYARALFKARQGKPGAAAALLAQLARDELPAPRRAALLAELANYPSPESRRQLLKALAHDDAGVRRAAIEAAATALAPRRLQNHLATLLNDPLRAVRASAAEQLLVLADQYAAPLPPDLFREYEQGQLQLRANAEAHFNLANLYRLTGRGEQVESSLREAEQRNPAFSPAGIALAQWLDGVSPSAGLQLLRERLRNHPDDAALQHALGLANIRARQTDEGVDALQQAHKLAPDNDTYAYVLAVALHDTGRREQALQLLRDQLRRHQANRALRMALLGYLPAGGERDTLIEDLRRQNPQDPALTAYRSPGATTARPINTGNEG